MKRYDPFEHADRLGIQVEHQKLRTTNGLWIPDHNLILLRSGMRVPQLRSTLAHELGHVEYGHEDDRPKHEVQADRYAANNLIRLDECRDLLAWSGNDIYRTALELNVSNRLLRVFLNVHRLVA